MRRHTVPHDRPAQFFFQTLGNPVRWGIVQLLREHGPQPAHAICRALRVEQSRCSHNLRRLERCGFLTARRNGRERVYALDTRTVGPLLKLVGRHVRAFCARVCIRRAKS